MLSAASTLVQSLFRAAKEPPFRLLAKQILRVWPTSIRLKSEWDAIGRPNYLAGVLAGADQAGREGISEISVIEFGVAGGQGLVALQEIASAVEKETKVGISVYGFDTGHGLPELTGDQRDHPDRWLAGDYKMDEQALRARLTKDTTLVLGEVKDTVAHFVSKVQHSPLGFIAIDVDLYSSTRDALQVLSLPGKRTLLHVPMYFDDVKRIFNHRFAGELLAIDEFNATNENVKIDRWRGITDGRAFPESDWLNRMYVAHDLEAISRTSAVRDHLKLELAT
jgi:hypothetical protein